MANEIKQLAAARQEADRRRKQGESQLQEYTVRLAEVDRNRGDLGDKVTKLQVRYSHLNVSFKRLTTMLRNVFKKLVLFIMTSCSVNFNHTPIALSGNSIYNSLLTREVFKREAF